MKQLFLRLFMSVYPVQLKPFQIAWHYVLSGLILIPSAALAQATPLPRVPIFPTAPYQQPNKSSSSARAAAVTIRYAKAGGSGNGSNWSQALGDLQAMINASASGDQVWIAGGTYKPGTTREAAFLLKNGGKRVRRLYRPEWYGRQCQQSHGHAFFDHPVRGHWPGG